MIRHGLLTESSFYFVPTTQNKNYAVERLRRPLRFAVALTELRFYFVLLEQNKNRGRSNGVAFLFLS